MRLNPFSPRFRSATSSPKSRTPAAFTRDLKSKGLISEWASRRSLNPFPPSLRVESLIELLREWPWELWGTPPIDSLDWVRETGCPAGFAVLGLTRRKDTGGAPRTEVLRKRDPADAHPVPRTSPFGAVLGLSTLSSSRNRRTAGAGAAAGGRGVIGGEIRVGVTLGRPLGVSSLATVPVVLSSVGTAVVIAMAWS